MMNNKFQDVDLYHVANSGSYVIYASELHDDIIAIENNNEVKNSNYDYTSDLKEAYAKFRVRGLKPITFDPKLRLDMIHNDVSKVIIDRINKTTMVLLKNGYSGFSKCSKNDEYSNIIGYRMAYLKAKQDEINSEIKKLNEIIDNKDYDWAYRVAISDMGRYI